VLIEVLRRLPANAKSPIATHSIVPEAAQKAVAQTS
jgi:hypothetical protein